jgi:hypothetical protein
MKWINFVVNEGVLGFECKIRGKEFEAEVGGGPRR